MMLKLSMLSFLQTKEWAEFQGSLERPFFEYDRDNIKAIVYRYPLPFGKSYLYIPHGPEMDPSKMLGGFKDPVRKFVVFLKDLAKKEKAIFIKIEPTVDYAAQLLTENGFRHSKKEIQPARTVILDLGKSEGELLSAMHHKTRYNIKVAEKHGIVVKEDSNVETFWRLLKKTAARDKFHSHTKDYYQKLFERIHGGVMHTKLFFAYHQNQPLAGAIILFYGDTGYYLHGASDYSQRKYMASHLLHWQIIKYLKDQAYKHYDLWGIDAHKWPGVTRFKLGWGGRTVEYPGSFDLKISGLWYLTYKLARRIL